MNFYNPSTILQSGGLKPSRLRERGGANRYNLRPSQSAPASLAAPVGPPAQPAPPEEEEPFIGMNFELPPDPALAQPAQLAAAYNDPVRLYRGLSRAAGRAAGAAVRAASDTVMNTGRAALRVVSGMRDPMIILNNAVHQVMYEGQLLQRVIMGRLRSEWAIPIEGLSEDQYPAIDMQGAITFYTYLINALNQGQLLQMRAAQIPFIDILLMGDPEEAHRVIKSYVENMRRIYVDANEAYRENTRNLHRHLLDGPNFEDGMPAHILEQIDSVNELVNDRLHQIDQWLHEVGPADGNGMFVLPADRAAAAALFGT